MDAFDPKLVEDVADGVVKGGATLAGKYIIERAASIIRAASALAWGDGSRAKSGMRKFRRWLFNGESDREKSDKKLLIIGAGGVGKSTTAKTLAGEFDLAAKRPGIYREDISVELFTLADDPHTEIVVPPGQLHRRYSWAEIEKSIAAGEFHGIIVVNSFGYHSIGDLSYTTHHLYKAGDPDAFLQRYLKDRRKDELRILRRLEPHIRANSEKCWLMTLVNKQDLWWREREKVEKYYLNGAYGKLIKSLTAATEGRFRAEIGYVSLVIANFVTGRNEVLKENSAGYGEFNQVESMQRVLRILELLRKWE